MSSAPLNGRDRNRPTRLLFGLDRMFRPVRTPPRDTPNPAAQAAAEAKRARRRERNRREHS